jgi:hypothetical protein
MHVDVDQPHTHRWRRVFFLPTFMCVCEYFRRAHTHSLARCASPPRPPGPREKENWQTERRPVPFLHAHFPTQNLQFYVCDTHHVLPKHLSCTCCNYRMPENPEHIFKIYKRWIHS